MSYADLVSLLSDRLVTHELKIRSIDPRLYTLLNKKRILVERLEEELRNPEKTVPFVAYLDSDTDLTECHEIYKSLYTSFIKDRINNAMVVDASLKFLLDRVDRVHVEESSANFFTRNFLMDEINALFSQISEIAVPLSSDPARPSSSGPPRPRPRNIIPPRASDTFSMDSFRSFEANLPPNENNQLRFDLSRTHSNHVPLWKWSIRFSGDDNVSASEFLQDVTDYCRSRNITEQELLQGISDLLTGSARKWHRSIVRSSPFSSWQDFTSRFLKDFEPQHQRERLLDWIKKRIQQPNESILKYFITMEDFFFRLPFVPSELERIRIIRNNLLPKYARAVALHDFSSVAQLKEACCSIEAVDMNLRERFGNPFPKYPFSQESSANRVKTAYPQTSNFQPKNVSNFSQREPNPNYDYPNLREKQIPVARQDPSVEKRPYPEHNRSTNGGYVNPFSRQPGPQFRSDGRPENDSLRRPYANGSAGDFARRNYSAQQTAANRNTNSNPREQHTIPNQQRQFTRHQNSSRISYLDIPQNSNTLVTDVQVHNPPVDLNTIGRLPENEPGTALSGPIAEPFNLGPTSDLL